MSEANLSEYEKIFLLHGVQVIKFFTIVFSFILFGWLRLKK